MMLKAEVLFFYIVKIISLLSYKNRGEKCIAGACILHKHNLACQFVVLHMFY